MDADAIIDLFAPFGPVSVRRMFGGAGIFADGLCIGYIKDGAIYLKADPATIPDFEREGCVPFSFKRRRGEVMTTSFWRMPDRLYDDPDELVTWARGALVAARGTALRKRKPSAKPGRRKTKPLLRKVTR